MRFTILIIINCITILTYGQISERIDSVMLSHQSRGFNGNVLYSKGDTIKFTGSYGYRDIDTKIPLNNSTIFDLASCSKQFTALAIVQLIEKDLISYETLIEEIIKDFPYPNITIEHLLKHQSGLPDYMSLLNKRSVWKRKHIANNQDVIKALKKNKPKIEFEPGTDYEYSNTGYLILASIIEKVSRKSYEEYLEDHVFSPAQMTDSRVYRRRYKPERIQNTSEGHSYSKRKNKYQKIELDKKQKYVYWLDGIVGDGMVNSTILDLEKWKQAVRYNKLITKASKEKMFKVDNLSVDYGYGFVIENKEKSGKLVYHFGSWAGYFTMTFYLPKTNEYIVALCNNEYEHFFDILNDILALRK